MQRILVLFALPLISLSQQLSRPQRTEPAPGIHLFTTADHGTVEVDGNSTAIISQDGVLIFDTNELPATAAIVLTELRKLTSQPVRYVVNSHWHYDHLMGNQVYKDAFPSAAFISHERTREIMDLNVNRYIQARLKQFPKDIEELQKTEPSSKDIPITRLFIEEFQKARYVAPTIAFATRMRLQMGNRDIRFRHLPGNTPGDIVAYLPNEKVLLTGDLLVHPVPYALSSYPTRWLAALKELATWDTTVIIPGHGAAQKDKQYLNVVIELVDTAINEVREASRSGANLDEVRKKITLDSYRARLAGDDKNLNQQFQDFLLKPLVERAFMEVRGGLD